MQNFGETSSAGNNSYNTNDNCIYMTALIYTSAQMTQSKTVSCIFVTFKQLVLHSLTMCPAFFMCVLLFVTVSPTFLARGEQHNNNVSFSENKRLIRVLIMPRSLRDDHHLLSREQQIVLVRLRTGDNRLNSHMHSKLKLASSQPASVVKKTKSQSMFYKDAPFTESQEKMCDLSALPWWPNSMAASWSWRRLLHSSPEWPWSCSLWTPRRRRRQLVLVFQDFSVLGHPVRTWRIY